MSELAAIARVRNRFVPVFIEIRGEPERLSPYYAPRPLPHYELYTRPRGRFVRGTGPTAGGPWTSLNAALAWLEHHWFGVDRRWPRGSWNHCDYSLVLFGAP